MKIKCIHYSKVSLDNCGFAILIGSQSLANMFDGGPFNGFLPCMKSTRRLQYVNCKLSK